MVAQLRQRAIFAKAENTGTAQGDAWHFDGAADMLTALAAENTTLRADNERLLNNTRIHISDDVARAALGEAMQTVATLRASEAAALERAEKAEAEKRSVMDSRTHFKISAGRQKERCHKLRHRQRALLSALETIRFATSLDDAKFKANVAIGGWSDDELIYNVRALTPTADKEPKT